jgi:hypothetical protein
MLYSILTGDVTSGSKNIKGGLNKIKLPLKYKLISNEITDIIQKCINNNGKYNSAYEVALDLKYFLSIKTPVASENKILKEIVKIGVRNKKTFLFVLFSFVSVIISLCMLYAQKVELTDQKAQIKEQSLELIKEQKTSNSLLLQTQELLSYGDPRVRMGVEISVKSILEQGEYRLVNSNEISNEIKAKMLTTIGDSYYGLTEYLKAEVLYRKAFDIYFYHLIDLSQEKVESQLKIINALNMQSKFDDSVVHAEVVLTKLINKGFEHPFETGILFSFNLAMRKTALTPDNTLYNFDFSKEVSNIKKTLWSKLSSTQKAQLLLFQINELYYGLGKNSLSATAEMDEYTYKTQAVPALKKAKEYCSRALSILKSNGTNNKIEVDLLFWMFRINFELRNDEEGNEYAKSAISKALQIYGPGHIEISKLHLVQYAMFSSVNVKKSLTEMQKAYAIMDVSLSENDWERYYYLDLLSQANLDAGDINESLQLALRTFGKIKKQELGKITKRGFDGVSASLFRYLDLNDLSDIPTDIQKLYLSVIDNYDNIWPKWLTIIDKQMLSLTAIVITKGSREYILKEANIALARLKKEPQKDEDVALYYDSLVCIELIRIYDYIGDKERIIEAYDIFKKTPPENPKYINNKITEIQSNLVVFSIMKKHNLASDDISNFKENTLHFLEKNNLKTNYYQEKLLFL